MKASAQSCHSVTEYFTTQNKQSLVQEINTLRLRLEFAQSQTKETEDDPQPSSSFLLNALIATCKQNCGKQKGGFRYNDDIKLFARYIFQVSGPKAYELLRVNLSNSLPSITSLKRVMTASTLAPKEGEFRFAEVHQFLSARKYPLKVFLSEDGTRMSSRVQFDRNTNQLVGLVPPLNNQGLPIIGSFPARSASEIKQHFENSSLSNYGYLFMAQPLCDGAVTFPVALFGSNNSFTAEDVVRRWSWMKHEAHQFGIVIVGFASDGDPRLLKAMQSSVFTLSRALGSAKWEWFVGDLLNFLICIQDLLHIATKIRNWFVRPALIRSFGNFIVAPAHILELIHKVSKDQHNLCSSDVYNRDKMNFRSMEKLYQENVSKLLEDNILGSDGTIAILNMTREILSSFLDKTLAPLERIKLLWKWIFVLRMWRKWLIDSGYSLENFITSNCYMCIEINGHSLIQLMRLLRDGGEDELFRPWLCTSQPCENLFRTARSMTSTLSTVINFSILDFLNRLRRIELQAEVEVKLQGKISFPSSHRASKRNQSPASSFKMPDDGEIEMAVMEAMSLARRTAAELGITSDNMLPSLSSFAPLNVEADADEEEGFLPVVDDETETCTAETSEACVGEAVDTAEDMCVISSGDVGVKTYTDVDLSSTSIFVKVYDGNGRAVIIKKTTLIYLLYEKGTKVSIDRLLRFKSTAATVHMSAHELTDYRTVNREKVINEDWCAFACRDLKSFLIGRILSFGHLSGKNRRELQCTESSVEVDSVHKREIACLCDWYSIQGNILVRDSTFSNGFHSTSYYICTIPRPQLSSGQASVPSNTASAVLSLFSAMKNKWRLQ